MPVTPEIEGNWLTNGETFSQMIYLGVDANSEDWREITPEEYAVLSKEVSSDE